MTSFLSFILMHFIVPEFRGVMLNVDPTSNLFVVPFITETVLEPVFVTYTIFVARFTSTKLATFGNSIVGGKNWTCISSGLRLLFTFISVTTSSLSGSITETVLEPVFVTYTIFVLKLISTPSG